MDWNFIIIGLYTGNPGDVFNACALFLKYWSPNGVIHSGSRTHLKITLTERQNHKLAVSALFEVICGSCKPPFPSLSGDIAVIQARVLTWGGQRLCWVDGGFIIYNFINLIMHNLNNGKQKRSRSVLATEIELNTLTNYTLIYTPNDRLLTETSHRALQNKSSYLFATNEESSKW